MHKYEWHCECLPCNTQDSTEACWYTSQFKRLNKVVCQALFDKATLGVISQGEPSFESFNFNFLDSTVSYLTQLPSGKILKCPIGHILFPEQIIKYRISNSRFICDWEEELIKELVPYSGIVCARHFLGKLQRAHTDAYVVHKKSKAKSNFIHNYIENSNVVANYFDLKGVVVISV
jgi:hypothetical protein